MAKAGAIFSKHEPEKVAEFQAGRGMFQSLQIDEIVLVVVKN